ncbi:MAG: metallopeptidase TldD-related protein [Anaerolineae bacterium]|nr:metallopeptidase TldD-related protein [Anaerolineae bacterium]
MKARILQTLTDLRTYALSKPCEIALFYHEEDSALMRFANSAVSLNTSEHLIRLEITAYAGRKRASYEMITDLTQMAEMRQGIDIAAEMVEHAQPLAYDPTIPVFSESYADESCYDAALAEIDGASKLATVNAAVTGLETQHLKLSGIFSSGVNTVAQINTRSEHTQFFRTTDAQVTVVLAHDTLKWEVQAEQSAQRKSDLDSQALREDLAFLVEQYTHAPAGQLPLGSYDVVFGPAATADLLNFMNWIGFNGGMARRGYACLREDQVGHKILSDKVTLVDDPSRRETFPYRRDYTGIPRGPFPLFQHGVFAAFTWAQDDADEYGAQPTGHSVGHKSLVLHGGSGDVDSLAALAAAPRDKDLLYIPFLHYVNIVNPTKGLVTGSSRFGALLLKQDGSIAIPFNVRLTQSVLDIFGDKVAWLSQQTVPYNTSHSYGARNPTAIIVPRFVRVNDLEISHANASF